MGNIGLYSSVAIGCGYYFFTITASRQKDKYYYKLFDTKTFLLHLLGAFLLGVFGFWRVVNFDGRELMYFAPFVYLLFLRLFNTLTILIYNRPVILATKWDSPPKGKNGIKFYDRLIFLLLFLVPIGGAVIVLMWIKKWMGIT